MKFVIVDENDFSYTKELIKGIIARNHGVKD